MTVLLVEDENLLRLLMADILEDAGFRVIEAANAWAALNWLEGGEDVQVLFTDVHMPLGIDGLERARRVHERWPEVGLVITSGLAQPSVEEIASHGTFSPSRVPRSGSCTRLSRLRRTPRRQLSPSPYIRRYCGSSFKDRLPTCSGADD